MSTTLWPRRSPRVWLQGCAVALLAMLTMPAAQAQYEAGKHYDVLQPALRTSDPKRVEVMEFFWYGCVHCYNLETLMTPWKKTLPEQAYVAGSPAVWQQPMDLHARAYYTAEILDVGEVMHPALFQAMHVDNNMLQTEDAIAKLFVSHGVKREQFDEVFNSYGVTSQLGQANARARSAKITGTPELVVNGKYRISTRKAGSQQEMLKIARWLVDQEIAALAAKS
jgi:thiol:disulfide interchange protein DsbA